MVGLAGFVGQVNIALSPNNDAEVSTKSSNAEGLYKRHKPKTATCFFVRDGDGECKHKKVKRRKMFVHPRVRRARFHHIALKALN